MANWNPWHGCHKISAGCEHCYVYRMDERHGKETGVVTRLKDFDKVLHKNRKGEYKIASDEIVYTCFTSDFFVEDADAWRDEAWNIMRQRRDLFFFMITKRIDRLMECIPYDWGTGWESPVRWKRWSAQRIVFPFIRQHLCVISMWYVNRCWSP